MKRLILLGALVIGLCGAALSGEAALKPRVEAFFEQWKGVPSLHGGLDPAGVDASGLVYLAAEALFEVRLPRNMAAQIEVGEPVSKSDLMPGDLVYFANPRFVGLYLGAGRFAHVSSRRGVIASPLEGGYWGPKYAGAKRLSGLPKITATIPFSDDASAFSGLASYYGPEMRGRPTASGEPYDPQAFTAAHPVLPFGARLRITHAQSGRQTTVRINDRGPFEPGRVLDLSEAAARALGGIREGLFPVQAEVLEGNE